MIVDLWHGRRRDLAAMVGNVGKRRLAFVVIGRLAAWLLTVAFGWHVAGASSAAAAVG